MSESQVRQDLQEGFAGESQANRKYLAYAGQAEKEGYPFVAKLFKAIADAETIHAHAHFKAMGGIGSTKDNLKAALEGETYEFSTMYPKFIEDAKKEGNAKAERSFHFANEAEKVHGSFYQRAMQNLDRQDNPPIYLCPVCGHIAEGEAPETCPICGAKKQAYREYQ